MADSATIVPAGTSIQSNSSMKESIDQIRTFVPIVSMLGWTILNQMLQVMDASPSDADKEKLLNVNNLDNLTDDQKDQIDDFEAKRTAGIHCSNFRIGLQWGYLACCVLISMWYYIRQAKIINCGHHKIHFDKKVQPYTYMAAHVAVSIVYLLVIQPQPIACHITRIDNDALTHLYVGQAALVLVITAISKVLHPSIFTKLPDAEVKQRLSGNATSPPPAKADGNNAGPDLQKGAEVHVALQTVVHNPSKATDAPTNDTNATNATDSTDAPKLAGK